ncbi:hypothetical protein [Flammeovirga pacifica]|uniref:Uncharacterized protein n=1 Tax=Flammeovirga pacifica TaxID=915059 RepID=A0A1S1YSK2_FLAPC|nr:hypothetical protein [Flammeovirga pacifica]OHX64007.1 hypothetical protein NH26_20570 [Flammeovirga pacifica]
MTTNKKFLIAMYSFIGIWVCIIAFLYLVMVKDDASSLEVDYQANDVQMIMEFDTLEYKRVTQKEVPEDFDIILFEVD